MTMRTDAMQGQATQGQDALDDLFAEARSTMPPPSEALMARVLADAMEVQPKAVVAVAPVAVRGPGVWSRLAALFGGAGALAGMGTAAMAGLFIGFVQPEGLSVLGDAVLGTPLETVELVSSVDALDALLAGN
jgi:hypothetical protein